MTTAERRRATFPIDRLSVSAYRIPTERPESDGTARWESTTLVLVEIDAGAARGTGWSYATAAAGKIVVDEFRPLVEGADAEDTRALWNRMVSAVRNLGRSGVASYAIAAVDVALWDLRARLYDVPLCDLLGTARGAVPIYGSGGFTSYDEQTLREQLGEWARAGFHAVKMKVGRDHRRDVERVARAREAIGANCALFVDGNGGYNVNEAIAIAHQFATLGVTWFEQPVDHRDLEGMQRVRDRAPGGMAITSGEYMTDTADAAAVARAVDVLQADATRCGGYTGFLAIDGFCEVSRLPLSTHCAPALHLHAASAALRVRHMEYFVDHVRIEKMLFDGTIEPVNGTLRPDRSRPGHGLSFKHTDAQKFAL
ncbi:MAG TPA: enolase C-terminal domain-like protein [Candidatus Acidoferrales bacterium]|nr:enolase C-terminal domain-like protein [Candidatus Acidoferrales bacterium]